MGRVCSPCIGDDELQRWIRGQRGKRGCEYCGGHDSPTVELDALGDHIRVRLENYYGYAADSLPYESSEGGYLGATWDTYDILYDQIGIDLPREGWAPAPKDLRSDLVGAVSDQTWCEYDWLRLDDDDALRYSWERFCDVVKHERRFFFGDIAHDLEDPDVLSPKEMLDAISSLAGDFGLVRVMSAGTRIYRARASDSPLRSAAALGPPPQDRALQSNRMNPPGIPMFYGGSSRQAATREIGGGTAYVGSFKVTRDLNILDLDALPELPSMFASIVRRRRLSLLFLHHFRREISRPVARDQLTHVDYIPTQIVTEYFRSRGLQKAKLYGIKYPSVASSGDWNVVLFATQENVDGCVDHPPHGHAAPETLLRLVSVRRLTYNAEPQLLHLSDDNTGG